MSGGGSGGSSAAGASQQTAGVPSTTGGGGMTSGGTGSMAGSAGMPDPPLTPNTCSEAGELRTAPPAGLELYAQDPIDEALPFSLHWIGNPPYDPFLLSATSLTDIDRDGDLDFASAQRELDGEGGGGMVWWEYCSADHWVVHFIGMGHQTSAAGNAMDVNEDGWMDLIAGDSWYENTKDPRSDMEWIRHPIGSPSSEEIVVGDVGGSARPEALYLWREHDPQFWRPGADPTAPWEQTVLSQNRQQQGGAIGDLDGDGDGDWLAGYRWWYRNVDGQGTQWETVEIFDDSNDALFDAPLSYIADLDGDGDDDFALVTHFGGGVAWAENDGTGMQFEFHSLATDKALMHAAVIADFDNDGDQDIFAGQNRGPSFIFANDGAGTFTEHTIVADARMHEARVGDVDCDGDLDIAGKPWGRPGNYGDTAELRDHVYLQNRFVDNGGTPRFDRGPYEEMHTVVGQNRACPVP